LTGCCWFYVSVQVARTLFFAFASLFLCSAPFVSTVLIAAVLLDWLDRDFAATDSKFDFLGLGFEQGSGCVGEGTR